jgi:hypothetical protein
MLGYQFGGSLLLPLLWLRKTINVLFTFRRMPGKMFSKRLHNQLPKSPGKDMIIIMSRAKTIKSTRLATHVFFNYNMSIKPFLLTCYTDLIFAFHAEA